MIRILVIDDEEMVRTTVRDILELDGYEVVEAANGRQGLRMFEADPTDLVVTDILMPEQEGLATIVKLRRGHPDVKIIAMSGGGAMRNLDFLGFAKKLRVAQTLVKPFETDDLLNAVRNVVDGT